MPPPGFARGATIGDNLRPMTPRRNIVAWALACAALLAGPARPAIDIDLESGDLRKINISVARFAGEESLDYRPSLIIVNDLTRSGFFRARVDDGLDARPGAGALPDFAKLRAGRQEFVVLGSVAPTQGGRVRVVFELLDTITEQSVGAFSYAVPPGQIRRAAHEISNWVHEHVLNEPGPFSSKIAYILKRSQDRYELRVADYDGFNSQAVVSAPEAMMSPEWSPDGNHILYVSFENDKPVVYTVSLVEGKRRVVANYRGNNSAPAIARDNRVAVALSKDGNTQIYLLNGAGEEPTRLRTSLGIDTEPEFSPDGRSLVFMSDAGGTPQIYLIGLGDEDARARRLSFGSRYNVSPAFSPDGRHIAYVRRTTGGFNVAVIDLEKGSSHTLTSVRLADSPSFAPNGKILLFKDETRPDVLNTVAVNGRIRIPFEKSEAGEIIDPVWGPAEAGWY